MDRKTIGVLLAGIGEKAGTDTFDLEMINLFADKYKFKLIFLGADISIPVYNFSKSKLDFDNMVNLIQESEKISSSKVIDLDKITSVDIDCFLIPGGYGNIYAYTNYLTNKDYTTITNSDINRLVKKIHEAKKPLIAIGLGVFILGKCLINTDNQIVLAYTEHNILNQLTNANIHTIDSKTSDAIYDEHNKILSSIGGIKGKYYLERYQSFEAIFQELVDIYTDS